MTVECMSCQIRLVSGVDMEHDPRDPFPVRTIRVRIEQAQVRDEMLLVIGGQFGICRCLSSTSGSSGGFGMGFLDLVT